MGGLAAHKLVGLVQGSVVVGHWSTFIVWTW